MMAFAGCAGMAVILGAVSLFGLTMENHTKTSGYEYYIDSASTAATDDKIDIYKKAIELNPTKEDAYLGMLEAMLSDNEFSTDDDVTMISVLNSKYNGRDKDNKTYFQANRSGYVEFSYQLGLAYYYSAGVNGDKSSAVGWFKNVTDADMNSLDFGENDHYKNAWQARAKILGRISDYYKNKIGQMNQMGDSEVSYRDYWDDLMALMDDNVASQDNVVTELRLYNEIVTQIYNRTNEFKDEAGLTQDVMNGALDDIENRMNAMNLDQNRLAEELKTNISATIDGARKNITAAFAYDSVNAGESTEGGNE